MNEPIVEEEPITNSLKNYINIFTKLSMQELVSQYGTKMLGIAVLASVIALYSSYQISTSVFMVIISYPIAYYLLKYSKFAQAIATFSIAICQPALMDDFDDLDEIEEEDNVKNLKVEDYSPLDLIKMDEEEFQNLVDQKGEDILLTKIQNEETISDSQVKVSESETPSRKSSTSSTSSLELDTFTVISDSDIQLIPNK